MTFADALRSFLTHSERGQAFKPNAWQIALPYLSEFQAFESGKLLRETVFAAAQESEEKGAVFALVWGFPAGYTSYLNQGSRKPKATLQTAIRDHLERLGKLIHSIREYGPRLGTPVDDLNIIRGLKTASTSKIAYFAGLRHNGNPCLIFDQQVIRAVGAQDYPELARMRLRLTERTAAGQIDNKNVTAFVDQPGNYEAYLEEVARLAGEMEWEFEEAQIERFLFELGSDIGRSKRLWTDLSRGVV